MATHSPQQAELQQERLHKRLARAEAALQKLRPKRDERAAAVLERATAILTQHQVAHLLQVTVSETAVTQRRSGKRGRPAADAPVTEATRWQVTLEVERQAETIALEEQVAGCWRTIGRSGLRSTAIIG
jgi:transposase